MRPEHSDELARLWHIHPGRPLGQQFEAGYVSAICLSADGSRMATVDYEHDNRFSLKLTIF